MGAIFVVDAGGGGDFMTIQAGLDAAASGDTVLVAAGIYSGPGNLSLDFDGRAIVLVSVEGPEMTVIDCESQARAFDFDRGESPAAVVSGFTITNGLADKGGAVRLRYNSGPTIKNCVLSHNRANVDGGALFCTAAADPVLVDVILRDNVAVVRGGGMCSEQGFTNVTGCTFEGNHAAYGGAVLLDYDFSASFTDCTFLENTSDDDGGGLFDYGSSPQLLRCTFTRNIASGEWYVDGGGLVSLNSDGAAMSECVFSQNEARSRFSMGGGACIHMATMTVTDCVFSMNLAWGTTWACGGGVYCYNEDDHWGPPCQFTGCTFEHNVCGGQGGGISCEHTAAPLVGCAFLSNRAVTGAGAHLRDYSGTVASCVFAENVASSHGGGINASSTSPLLSPVLSCVTFYGNVAPDGGGVRIYGSCSPSIENTIIAFGQGGGAVTCRPADADLSLMCCDVYGNVGGDWEGCIADQAGLYGNMSQDPVFCNAQAGDFSIDASSPCAELSNPECGLVGAFGVGCESTPVIGTSWGAIKAMYR